MPGTTHSLPPLGVTKAGPSRPGSLLRDLFVWAFERSVKRYLVLRQEVGEPDPFRSRYRAALLEVVGTVIRQDIPEAERYVTDWIKRNVPADDQTPSLSWRVKS